MRQGKSKSQSKSKIKTQLRIVAPLALPDNVDTDVGRPVVHPQQDVTPVTTLSGGRGERLVVCRYPAYIVEVLITKI